MLQLPREIKEKYASLPTDSIWDAIEVASIKAISTIFQVGATANIGEDGILHIHLLRDGNQEEISVNSLNRKAKRRLLDEIEKELMLRQACYDAWSYATIRGSVQTGRIERIRTDGTLEVLVELLDLITPITIYAECPLQHQPPHERLKYQPGEMLEFFIVSCLPITNGRLSKVRVIVSRTARELPSRLLGKLTGMSGIRCTKRIPGGYSRIIAQHKIPKSAINTVGKKLKEHLEVTCLAK